MKDRPCPTEPCRKAGSEPPDRPARMNAGCLRGAHGTDAGPYPQGPASSWAIGQAAFLPGAMIPGVIIRESPLSWERICAIFARPTPLMSWVEWA